MVRKLLPIRSPPLLSPIHSSSSSSSSSSIHLPPLFLRPLIHSTTPANLATFRHWAHTLTLSTPLPPLPTSHLLRELSWLLQAATSSPPPTNTNNTVIPLRLPLTDLYSLWTQRIHHRRPFQYLVGNEHWRDLVLVVREGVLIPRPETEVLVDLVREVEGFGEGVWADLGTGSGAVAVGIGRELGEKGRVIGVDLSEVAVEVARVNVERIKLR